VLCDEITTGLDASVQAAVLNMLTELQASQGTALLLVSHDLNMVQHFADRVAVMHRGRLVETRPVYGMSPPPYHPYTEMLLAAMPVAQPGLTARMIEMRNGPAPAQGCSFAGGCPRRPDDRCLAPPPRQAIADGHWIACHLPPATLAAVPPIWAAS
jgi:peptide/nickel transport system ATP-binding protein